MNKKQMDYINKYKREHYRRITVEFDREFYEQKLLPSIKDTGMSTSAWIKQACEEKLKRFTRRIRKTE